MRVKVLAIAALGVWAATAQAGEIANWYWPYGDIPQEVGEIPVVMDVPQWVRVVDWDKLAIHLLPRTPYEYEGCVDIAVEARGDLNVSAEFTPTGAVPGKYSSSLSVLDADSAAVTLRSCVHVEVETLPPLNTNVRVGTVMLKISPKP